MKRFIKLITLSVAVALTVALCAISGCGLISGELWTDVEYDNEDTYTIGGGEITETISDIYIYWSDDSVTVAYYEGESVKIEETADKEIEEQLTLRQKVDNGKLTVQFASNGRHDIRGLNKKLNVLIPAGVTLNNVNIKSVAGDIDSRVDAGQLTIETTSGNITAGGTAVQVDVKTVSGKITVSQLTPTYVQAMSVTGDIDVTFNGAAGLVIGTVSGNVNISLPDTFGFKLTLDTVSGKLDSELELTQNDNEYTRLGGGAIFRAETVTGNVNIAKKG